MQPDARYHGPTQQMSPLLKYDAADETELVRRIVAGDVESFARIVERWQGPLVNLAWRYCRERSRAEEMAQEAFLRIWRNLGSWRGESRFSSWIFAVAANVYRNELKKMPTELQQIDQIQEPLFPAGQLDGLARSRREERLRRAVLHLPMKYREPVILYYFHEMDLAAAAATLGMPEGTLKARLSRARRILRERFPQLEEEFEGLTLSPEATL